MNVFIALYYPVMNELIKEILINKTNSTQVLKVEHIQNLWMNYGEISRVYLDNTSVILKLVSFPKEVHPRKIKSYEVETNWYENYNDKSELFYSPRHIASGQTDKYKFLILEDLKESGFKPKKRINQKEIEACLKWLANFHNYYLNKSCTDLWKIGTYWHLETRPDEFLALTDNILKNFALGIDQKLNSAKFKTLVHGDAKLANFLFSDSMVAAVDFQYTGIGVGIKDLAYFLSSVYSENELFENEAKCLDIYFNELNNKEVEKEWREHYCFAWCDFYRFLQGWAPDHYKINSYMEVMKEKAINVFK